MAHIYQIIVQGHLDADWSEELEGLTITHRSNGTSLLSGPLPDQSALHGLLLKVRDLGLSLLSLRHDQELYHIAHIHGKMIGDFIVRLKNGSLEFFNDRNNPFGEPLDKRTPDVLLLPHEAAELKKFLETCLPDGE